MGKTAHFGPRVQGSKNYEKEAAAMERGESHFGTRVTGARPGIDDPDSRARSASEFGPLVTNEAEREDVSVEELEDILAENPTHFRQLYENELSRPGGPRKAALEVFDLVEMGPKGEGRQHIHREIQTLLGGIDPAGPRALAEADAIRDRAEENEKLNEENKLLQDAPRLKALKEREDNLKAVRGNPQAQSASEGQQPKAKSRSKAKSARKSATKPKSGAKKTSEG